MKPSIPKGTRDFLPQEVAQRNFIFECIKEEFELFGYQPIETPVLENLSTLTGKYGEEGDRLLFKVLNNGDYLKKADQKALQTRDSAGLVSSIADRGLRYDLTVPFARFVVMHRNDLALPFKRYQIQPVWRADRPQKGRYREFYQCDADAIGSDSLLLEAEYLSMIDRVFTKLGLSVEILLNSRKVLTAIARLVGAEERLTEMTVAVDKLAKIGWEGVLKELERRGFEQNQREQIQALFAKSFAELRKDLLQDEIGVEGLAEIDQVTKYLKTETLQNQLSIDPTLARGLNYYTGCILEVRSKELEYGSILGGGRYADLTGVFGMPGLSGIGISFGVERIYDIMRELGRFPASIGASVDTLVLGMDQDHLETAFGIASTLRSHGISAAAHPDLGKLGKLLKYANKVGAHHVLVVGLEEEVEDIVWKNMKTGHQEISPLDHIIETMSNVSD